MKKQVLLFVAFSLTLNSWGQTKIEITKTTTPPAIDGVVDAVWTNADTIGIHNNFPENTPSVESTWRALWDDDALYILVEVADDTITPFSSCIEGEETKGFKYDKIEVYYDINDTLIDGHGPNSLPADERSVHSNGHMQSAPDTDEALYGTESTMSAKDFRFAEIDYSYNLFSEGYIFESRIYWENLIFPNGETMDGTMAMNREIGFDVVVIDRDALDGGRQRVAWHYTGAVDEPEPFKNMDDCGIIICKGAATSLANEIQDITTKVYPNPAQNSFFVKNAMNSNFRLISLSGQTMINKDITSENEVINISGIAPGIYIVSVDGNYHKLIVE